MIHQPNQLKVYRQGYGCTRGIEYYVCIIIIFEGLMYTFLLVL